MGWREIPTLEKCFLPESVSSVGGGLWMVISSTFMGGRRAKGACPWASSRMVMPNDQMSARELYLGRHGGRQGLPGRNLEHLSSFWVIVALNSVSLVWRDTACASWGMLLPDC